MEKSQSQDEKHLDENERYCPQKDVGQKEVKKESESEIENERGSYLQIPEAKRPLAPETVDETAAS